MSFQKGNTEILKEALSASNEVEELVNQIIDEELERRKSSEVKV